MKRPGPAGLTVVAAFAIVFAIEFRTLLAMFGIEVAAGTYYPLAAAALGALLLALFAFTEDVESRQSTTQG